MPVAPSSLLYAPVSILACFLPVQHNPLSRSSSWAVSNLPRRSRRSIPLLFPTYQVSAPISKTTTRSLWPAVLSCHISGMTYIVGLFSHAGRCNRQRFACVSYGYIIKTTCTFLRIWNLYQSCRRLIDTSPLLKSLGGVERRCQGQICFIPSVVVVCTHSLKLELRSQVSYQGKECVALFVE